MNGPKRFSISLNSDLAGCDGHFSDAQNPAEFDATTNLAYQGQSTAYPTWTSVRVVRVRRAHLYTEPGRANGRKGPYLVEGDGVGVNQVGVGASAGWLRVNYSTLVKATRAAVFPSHVTISGWIRELDLFPTPVEVGVAAPRARR